MIKTIEKYFKKKNLTDFEKKDILIEPVLEIISFIYSIVLKIKKIYDKSKPLKKFNIKIISVGNIELGGTGKTPLVKFIFRYLQSKGKKTGIILRGYKSKYEYKNFMIDISDKSKKIDSSIGDESYEYYNSFEHGYIFIGKDRVKSIEQAIREKLDIVILDDGFQVKNIKKDFEILLEGDYPEKAYKLFPAGVLRENKTDKYDLKVKISDVSNPKSEDNLCRLERKLAGIYTLNNEVIAKDILKNKRVIGFCGIARPFSFLNILKNNLNLDFLIVLGFCDHYYYNKSDEIKINHMIKKYNIDYLITTEKDIIKLTNMKLDKEIFYLKLNLEFINNKELLIKKLDEIAK